MRSFPSGQICPLGALVADVVEPAVDRRVSRGNTVGIGPRINWGLVKEVEGVFIALVGGFLRGPVRRDVLVIEALLLDPVVVGVRFVGVHSGAPVVTLDFRSERGGVT